MTPPIRQLGRCGLPLTVLGAGTYVMGGGGWAGSWGFQDDASSIAALGRAFGLGINWIDTAPAYGLGHAEEIVCQALTGTPLADRPFVFTKCGRRWSEADRAAPLTGNLRPASIREECEASLRRLGVECIDLYQIHWPDLTTGTPVEDSWGEMSRLVEEGKVRFAGVCNFDVALLERCERIRHVDSLQPPFSLITRGAAADVIPWCAAHGTGVITHSSMKSGLLTDSFSADRIEAMEQGDWRRRNPDFQEPALSRNVALRDALRPVAQRHRATVSDVALAWVLAWSGVTGAIVGSRSPTQVEGWIGTASVELAPADFDEIADAIETTGAGSGPTRPAVG